MVELPPYREFARVQVIHNSADPAASSVDVYVNGNRAIDDFAFRSATPFLELPANTPLQIGVAPGTSTGPGDILATFDLELDSGERYVVVANGVLDPNSFAPNPDGRSTGFNLYIRDDVVGADWKTFSGESASTPSKGLDDDDVAILAFHGATDAHAVDVRVRDHKKSDGLFKDLEYGEFSKYSKLDDERYILDLTAAGDKDLLASFEADLRGLGDGAAIVFASGFLSPDANQGGPAFGLCGAARRSSGGAAAVP